MLLCLRAPASYQRPSGASCLGANLSYNIIALSAALRLTQGDVDAHRNLGMYFEVSARAGCSD